MLPNSIFIYFRLKLSNFVTFESIVINSEIQVKISQNLAFFD